MRFKELRQQRGMVCATWQRNWDTVRSISQLGNGRNDMLLGTAVPLTKFLR